MQEIFSMIELSPKRKAAPYRCDNHFIRAAERIAALLGSREVQASHFALATLDDLLGALYSFILALHNEPSFKFRPKGQPIEAHVVLKRSRSIARAHTIRLTGKWMAGLHFNSGLFRLLAVYHRSLKLVLGKPSCKDQIGSELDPKSLISLAKTKYKQWTGAKWANINVETVRKEINEIKHDTAGIYWGRRVSETKAVLAMAELLDLVETWASQALIAASQPQPPGTSR
jgi:hypothetical protein